MAGSTEEEGEEDGGGEDEALHAGLRRARRRVAAAGGGGIRSRLASGDFARGGRSRRRRRWGLAGGDLRHRSSGRRRSGRCCVTEDVRFASLWAGTVVDCLTGGRDTGCEYCWLWFKAQSKRPRACWARKGLKTSDQPTQHCC